MANHFPTTLLTDAHVKYIQVLDDQHSNIEYWYSEHLRLNGLYWGLTALCLLDRPQALSRPDLISFVLSCQSSNGGFGAAPSHDAHLLSTVSAIQILVMIDGLEVLENSTKGGINAVVAFITSCQNQVNGTFSGDEWGETDTRYLYGALNALSLLNRLESINTVLAENYLISCQNVDGGFGSQPGAESHAGQAFTCIAALSILKKTNRIDTESLGVWLSERQLPNGGLNGRPEKLEDVCYSWWVLSSMALVNKLHYVDAKSLTKFILSCQDPELGGFADRPGNRADVFHTVFGLAGLSILGYPGLLRINPTYCMPERVLDRTLSR